jgi:hypothetical protein
VSPRKRSSRTPRTSCLEPHSETILLREVPRAAAGNQARVSHAVTPLCLFAADGNASESILISSGLQDFNRMPVRRHSHAVLPTELIRERFFDCVPLVT